MTKRKKMKAVPIISEKADFDQSFVSFIDEIGRLHGEEAARSYRALREQETVSMAKDGVSAYPDTDEQQQAFLSLRIEGQ